MANVITEEVKRNKILEALIIAKNIEEVSAIAEVSRKTIYDYLNKDSNLLANYRNLKRTQFRELAETLSEMNIKAVNNIQSLAEDKDTPTAIKLQANLKILELFMKTRELENSINRKAYLENRPRFSVDDDISEYMNDYL